MDCANKNWIIIVSAGNATRFGKDKALTVLYDKPVICHTVQTAKQVCPNVIVVANQNNLDTFKQLFGDEVILTTGGNTRSQSVKKGFALLPDDVELVAIQDGARPFTTPNLYKLAFDVAKQKGSAIPVIPPTDTVYQKTNDKILLLSREYLALAQTPQVFDAKKLAIAYELTTNQNETDDGQVWLNAYGQLSFIQGERTNRKITYIDDLPTQKVGVGFDAHRLVSGRPLMLCGVKVPYHLGLEGHSDADVALHALTDAILSAIGQKDIGQLFPDSDPRYKNIDSSILLSRAWNMAKDKGYSLLNASLVIMAQSPKLAPYIEQMKNRLAQLLDANITQINVSATTTENLGITAEGKGMACYANVLIYS